MDYDENDFQSQNFHLVGEDKFSANLRSFTLPKFDHDEHLRFDSLVEEEVLLGIQSQANNWIDFPPGSSAIEFSSSAVESCSIARHKNVWSEATSSESVDLLLKSMGEDEVINNKAVIMETSANEESHGIDDRVVLYLEKDDDHKSYMVNVLPVDLKFSQDKVQENLSGSNVGQREMLPDVHGLSQVAEEEVSRIAMYIDHSNGKFSSDGERGDIVTSYYSAIEKSKTDDDVLCEEILNKKGVHEVLKRTEAPSVGNSGSCVLDSQSLEFNQDVKLVENDKLSTGVFSGGHLSCISSNSDFLSDEAHDDKTLLMYSDDKTSAQIESKADALGPLNGISISSVFPEKSDGLVVDIPYQTNYLNSNSEKCDFLCVKEECMSRVALLQEENIDNNSVTVSSKSILKINPLTKVYQNAGDRQPFDSVDNDDVHGNRTQLIKNSVVPCDDIEGENDIYTDPIDDNQDPVVQLVEKKNSEVENGTQMLTESPTSIHVHSEAQETEIGSCGRMSAYSPSFSYEKSGLIVDGNHDKYRDVDRQQVNLDEDKGLHGKVSSLTYMDPGRIMSCPVSKIIEKVQDLPLAVEDTAELSLGASANKLVVEEFGKKEQLIRILSKSDIIQDDRKDLNNSCIASEKGSLLASVFYPLKTEDSHPEEVLHCESGSQMAFAVKSSDPQLSQGTSSLNIALEQKGPLSGLAMSDSFFREGNELKLSGASVLSNSTKKIDIEIGNRKATGLVFVEDTVAKEQLSNTVLQPPSPVQSIDFTIPQNNISSSAGNGVGDCKTLGMEGNDTCHGPHEGNIDILNSLEVVSHAGNEASIVSDNLNSHLHSSKITTGATPESNSSEAQTGKPSSSEHNCGSPMVINFSGCNADNSDHQEQKISVNTTSAFSAKDEITDNVYRSSNDLHCTSVDDGSFIFGVSPSKDLTERHNHSELCLANLKIPKENTQELSAEVKVFDSSAETPIQGKTKNKSRPSNEKNTGSKEKIKKEARALKHSSVMDANCSISSYKSIGNLSNDRSLIEMQEKSPTEHGDVKTSPSLDAPTSIIPDLNSSSSLALSHHHFTDLQQVQLRAQIFVYGSLISGMPPDEAYMISAFGGADGGRNLWHGVWHVSIERFQNQKSPLGCYDTPHSRPVGNDVQSKVPTTCATKSSNIMISSSGLSSLSLPSPLWSLSHGSDGNHASIARGTYMNFSQTPSPLPRQSFVSRQHVGANSSWLSQSPRPLPWFFSSQISALDGIPQYSTVHITETARMTPVRDSCGSHTPTVDVASHRVLMHAPDTSATTAAGLQMETTKGAANTVNSKYTATTQKVRKRKKCTIAEDLSVPSSQVLADYVCTPSAFKSPPLPSTSMLFSSNSQLNSINHAPASISTSHIISPSHQQISILYEETCSKLEQAKLQAEDAAALAASTVKYSQGIWSQLAAYKNSGIVLQIEEKLSSAAVAAAAAASVAKAAAAAANVASAAALQAKIMAEEATSSTRTVNTVFNPESDILDIGNRLTALPPVAILEGMDKVHGSGAIISAASEAARRRVESASAATKRAENLDAIVKAAELAAEAVTQAGAIIAMGDPLPFTLRELVDAGPEGFWRGHYGKSTKLSKQTDMHDEEHVGFGSINLPVGSAKQLDGQYSNDKETQQAAGKGEISSLNGCHPRFQGSAPVLPAGNFTNVGLKADHVVISSIQKDSVVEVMSDEDGLKGAWLSARVLDINDNKAYICYSDVSNSEGKLKEWIMLETGEKAPRIRAASSITSVKHEGTRKRHRAHLGSYIWDVGDHVDAWMHDRWWEGTITEKNSGDESKLTVHFPGMGDKHVVNAWNLRPSLIWKDGQWVEWSHANGKPSKPHEGDTPQVKRQRLDRLEEQGNSEVDLDGMGKLSKKILVEESRKPDDSRPLVLSAKDRSFTVGKNSSEHVSSDALKQKRSGLQKERSRVVFGVPRPGKKRKFMEVSKHYVANKSDKIGEGKDPIKFAKYLMPQASRQSRNTSKEKKAVQIKPRVGGGKAVDAQRFPIRGVVGKEKASVSTSNDRSVHHKNVISAFKGNANCSDKNAFKFGSFQNQAEKKKDSAVESEHPTHPAPASLPKKGSTPGSQADFAAGDRGASAVEDKGHGNTGKPTTEVMEPRRSCRRIQPTSRLLEGIQSSLVISKLPSISHERKPPRGGSSSRGNTRG